MRSIGSVLFIMVWALLGVAAAQGQGQSGPHYAPQHKGTNDESGGAAPSLKGAKLTKVNKFDAAAKVRVPLKPLKTLGDGGSGDTGKRKPKPSAGSDDGTSRKPYRLNSKGDWGPSGVKVFKGGHQISGPSEGVSRTTRRPTGGGDEDANSRRLRRGSTGDGGDSPSRPRGFRRPH